MFAFVYLFANLALIPAEAYASRLKKDRAVQALPPVQSVDYTPKEKWRGGILPAGLSSALVGVLLPESEQADYKVAKVSLSEISKTLFLSYERSPLNRYATARPPGLFFSKEGKAAEPQPMHFQEYGYVALDANGKQATVLQTVFEKQDFVSSFARVPVEGTPQDPPVKLSTFQGMPLAVEFSRSGRKAAAMMREGKVYLFDSVSPTQGGTVELGPETASLHSRFSADERSLGVCVFDTSKESIDEREIQVIDTRRLEKLTSIPFEKGDCRSFDFSPDGQKVFYVKKGILFVWEVATEKEVLVHKLTEASYRLAHSPKDPFLLIGQWGERVALVNSISGEPIAEIVVGKDQVPPPLVGFGENGTDFFASTDSTDLAWGDLNRLGGPPTSVKEALSDLASPSFPNFQATRWLHSHSAELLDYLSVNTKETPLPKDLPQLLESMVRDWDSDKFKVRRSASLRGRKALEGLPWGAQREAKTLVDGFLQTALNNSSSPLEIKVRYQEWLRSGDLPVLRQIEDSEPYRRQIDAALGKPFPWETVSPKGP